LIAVVCGWGGDLCAGPSGDIATAPAPTELQYRIVRRLLTNQGDYIWHSSYGAGLGVFVGDTYSAGTVETTIQNQLQHEALVASSPAPTIQMGQSPTGDFGTKSVMIQYQINGIFTGSSVVLELGA
jgi:hypothetical protein